MTTSTWAFGKANAYGTLRPAISSINTSQHSRQYASGLAAAFQPEVPSNGKPVRAQDVSASQRELFMDVLSANATRRDAKQYLARFQTPTSKASGAPGNPNGRLRRDQGRQEHIGVNLGGLYAPARAITDAPRFEREVRDERARVAVQQELHVALVCMSAPEALSDSVLDGLATTLSQLVKLDMRIVIVLELAGDYPEISIRARRTAIAEQVERFSQAIRRYSAEGSRFVTGTLEISDDGEVDVTVPKLILGPLKRGVVPIIPALAHTQTGQLVRAGVEDVMAGLTRALRGKVGEPGPPSGHATSTLLDRIIVLDPAGGIPAKHRSDNAHVFINLTQEYDGIEAELSQYAAWDDGVSHPNMYDQHMANLRMLSNCLRMLPPASSGLIISPYEAATSSQDSAQDSTIGTGTRRQKNTLIHNLLTNKPMVSSSLPAGRLSTGGSDAPPTAIPAATLVKRGMPVSTVPAIQRGQGWHVPANGISDLELDRNPNIDFPRLVHLIEDSFRRKLDVTHYLDRIRNRTAGLVVAGEYEGAAIFTWEQPPHTTDPSRLVPYLDKFAVLQSSQGSSGVADILFQSMVRSCFPRGVCWRSRKDNPVNKWYFERCAGSWQIPGTQWTMFWTGEGVVEGSERWGDYVGLCRDVVPSWADGRKPD
ncbi:Amino-acid acetyltransferase, mitochondrial [Friedmanniomyces endolithicus]|uniref:Amino-acid acetyltransferase, mitochondrial n=1 Tax=Friedmanniomyces endolithicus TaxID=329885 RepID=A0AAN6QPN5_9PEZI|nr:Amino-acid acetyltransferase, mitochondrial [Friedmanniomyces endolithicus]KAK0806899.1 Amino-acid acetyltransferase, mitochondrial [Friedmanniomyces endolithicus]KAK0821632.1 Amino-acid acetyltransferase, mitochondrial [Friedmanniomyces endolithicus]KAK0857083.1 Amino-acid acetyltransferase, mitochondrial [Friedmanniomyces endolithicus]KAK0882410.1 Amino-acid acetyltransferase, mitochondrial [Friedmanniomyces endolithicus]